MGNININTLPYAHDIALMAEPETDLHAILDKGAEVSQEKGLD